MLKVEARQRWANVPVDNALADSTSRKLMSTDEEIYETNESSSFSRTLLNHRSDKFKPRDVCKKMSNLNMVGGNIPNNFFKGMSRWEDCCAQCSQRTDCKAWAVNKGTNLEKRGCYLKGVGFTTRKERRFISGYMKNSPAT